MVSTSFFGGIDEIGGNKVQIKSKDTSLFLDFGMSFSKYNRYYSDLQPRKANGLIDFCEFGLLPKIKGIYREDYLKHSRLNFDKEPSVDGVLLTHAHLDHAGCIHHLREDIPIFLTEETYLILKALEDTSKSSFMDLITLKKDFHFVPKKRGEGYTRLRGNNAKIERDIHKIEPFKKVQIGDLNVKNIPVGHCPGATGFIIENDEDTIVYTGDIRFHGRNPETTKKFVKESQKMQPTILISEGTRIDETKTITEEKVEKNVTNLIKDSHDMVIVDYPLRDLNRLQTFYNAATKTGRKLVINLKQAYLLKLFHGKGYPELDDVEIYIPKKGWSLLDDDSVVAVDGKWIESSKLEKYNKKTDYDTWERNLISLENTVTYKDIKTDPSKYIFRCDPFELRELIDIKPEKGIYIRSLTESEENDYYDRQTANTWIKHFNLKLFEKGMCTSGHASGPEILQMIEKINPENVYPIHTLHKEKFKDLEKQGIKVHYPKLS